MLIKCPYCGTRPSEEFTVLGDASVKRPTSNDPSTMDQWFDYVYLRDNRKGRMSEYWHHSGGCRSWIVVDRDTQTHEVFGTMTARDWAVQTPTPHPSPQGGGALRERTQQITNKENPTAPQGGGEFRNRDPSQSSLSSSSPPLGGGELRDRAREQAVPTKKGKR